MGSAFVFLYQRKSNISFQLSIMSCVLMDSTLIFRYLSYKGLPPPSLIWTGFSLCLLHPCPSGFISWVLCFLALIQFCFFFFFNSIQNFYLFLAALSLHFCRQTVSLQRVGATICCDVWACHCSVLSCCRAPALGHTGLSSCSPWAQ